MLLRQGVASPEDIDRAMILGTSHPMGPLQLADFIGKKSAVVFVATEFLADSSQLTVIMGGRPGYMPFSHQNIA